MMQGENDANADCAPPPRYVADRGRNPVLNRRSLSLPTDDGPRIAAVIALGALGVTASLAAEAGVAGWLGSGLALTMLGIAIIDARSFIIPNWLNAVAFGLGLIAAAVTAATGQLWLAWLEAGGRAVVLVLLFGAVRARYFRLRGRHGIGLGDVKLAAVAGCWLGWSMIPVAVEIAALSALAVQMLRGRVRPTTRLPFGLYLAPSIWIGWLLQATVFRGW